MIIYNQNNIKKKQQIFILIQIFIRILNMVIFPKKKLSKVKIKKKKHFQKSNINLNNIINIKSWCYSLWISWE